MVPDVAGHDGDAADRVVEPGGGVLEVGHQHAARGIDAQEAVGVDVERRFGLAERPLVDERDGAGDAAGAGGRADAGAVAPEPGLEREAGHAERRRAVPKVTWSLVPSKSRAAPAATEAWRSPQAKAAERLPMPSTATTT